MSAIILLVLLGAALVFLETVLVGGVWAIAGILCCAWAVWMALAEYGIWAASIVGAVSIALCIAAFLVWLYGYSQNSVREKILSQFKAGR